jgi:signal transduction histidine kinase
VVRIDIASDLPTVQANRDLMIALISNLLGNAIKFSRDGGKVDVIARHENDFVLLQVIDQGIGMSEEDLGHLFEKFYRGSSAKDAGVRGTGLGLVLSKQAVEVHGGTISVESRLGHGTCFTVSLPIGYGMSLARHDYRPAGGGYLADELTATTVGSLTGV